MPILRNYGIWIETDGQRNEEYDTKVENNVVTCYIASEAGKIFRINCKSHKVPPRVSSAIDISFDGKYLDGHIWHYERSTVKGHWIDATSYRPYKFSNTILTDDGGLSDVSDDMGTISVSVFRVIAIRRKRFVPRAIPNDLRTPLNESVKKSSFHRVDLDDNVYKVKKSEEGLSITTRPYANDNGPYVTFRFVYRPKEILQALEIIPRIRVEGKKRARSPTSAAGSSTARRVCKTRSSSGVKVESDVIDLSDDDETERALLAQQAEVARKLAELKMRKGKGGTIVKREVKTERGISKSADTTQLVMNTTV